jgi:hypothetical protein
MIRTAKANGRLASLPALYPDLRRFVQSETADIIVLLAVEAHHRIHGTKPRAVLKPARRGAV